MAKTISIRLTVEQAEALLTVANEGLADMVARDDDAEDEAGKRAEAAIEKLCAAIAAAEGK